MKKTDKILQEPKQTKKSILNRILIIYAFFSIALLSILSIRRVTDFAYGLLGYGWTVSILIVIAYSAFFLIFFYFPIVGLIESISKIRNKKEVLASSLKSLFYTFIILIALIPFVLSSFHIRQFEPVKTSPLTYQIEHDMLDRLKESGNSYVLSSYEIRLHDKATGYFALDSKGESGKVEYKVISCYPISSDVDEDCRAFKFEIPEKIVIEKDEPYVGYFILSRKDDKVQGAYGMTLEFLNKDTGKIYQIEFYLWLE